MSDNATLVERLHMYAELVEEDGYEGETPRLAAARIAELEVQVTWSAARIAELEAERDTQKSWEGAAHEYEEQARFARALTAKAEAERDAAIKRVADLTEPLKYGDMLCFKRGTVDRMAKEKAELEAALEGAEQRGALILEVIAERDRLKAALQALYDDNADYIKINRLMRGDGKSAIHNQVMVQARAALSDPSGEES